MSLIQCETCAGNGEVVNDWDAYLHPHDGAPAEAGVKDCSECDGMGWFDDGGSLDDEGSIMTASAVIFLADTGEIS